MDSKQFISEKLQKMVAKFNHIKAKYHFDEVANTHMVEITPSEVFHNDQEYGQYEEELIYSFITEFPAENVCFISDVSVIGLEGVDHEFKGELFGWTLINPHYGYILPDITNVVIHNSHTSLLPSVSVISTSGYLNINLINQRQIKITPMDTQTRLLHGISVVQTKISQEIDYSESQTSEPNFSLAA